MLAIIGTEKLIVTEVDRRNDRQTEIELLYGTLLIAWWDKKS